MYHRTAEIEIETGVSISFDIPEQEAFSERAPQRPLRILLAEDDDEMRKLLTMVLSNEGYEVTECADGSCLADQLRYPVSLEKAREYNLIISDIRMPVFTGLQILKAGQKFENFPPTILITAFGNQEVHEQAKWWGAVALLDKPFEIDELLVKVQRYIRPILRNQENSNPEKNASNN